MNKITLQPAMKLALNIYTPPFRHESGYIFDSNSKVVADSADGGMESENFIALRVRGWGHIQHIPKPEVMQDLIGDLIANAMTEYWVRHQTNEKEFNSRVQKAER